MTAAQVWVALVAGLALAYGWVAFVAFLRVQEYRGRERARRDRLRLAANLGMGLTEDDDPQLSDAELAAQEQMARHKRFVDKQVRRQAANS